jgi:hypothetical protein
MVERLQLNVICVNYRWDGKAHGCALEKHDHACSDPMNQPACGDFRGTPRARPLAGGKQKQPPRARAKPRTAEADDEFAEHCPCARRAR